jgi:outer membrane protein insertion porin family
VDVTAEAAEAPTAEERVVPMHVRITVEEWPAVRLRYGFVVAEERPQDNPEGRELVPGLSVDVVRRTLFGRAVAVGSALTLQRREQDGRVFLTAPTFLGLPVGSSFIAERSRETRPNQTLVTTGSTFTWEQRARVAGNLAVSYAYTFSQDHTYDTNPLVPPELRHDTKITRAWLNTTQVWDTRDDPADTSRGLFVSSSFAFAPEALGSDYRFTRELVQAYYFRPWGNAILASAARVGVAVPMGLRVLSPGDGFRTGGSRTVRGVGEDSLGPSDFFGPLDGQSMIVFNQELRLPLYRWVRGVAFLDAGNVFARPRDTSLRDLVGSAGFGLRVATPFALLRVDYGKSIWGRPSDSGRWSFGIGQIF